MKKPCGVHTNRCDEVAILNKGEFGHGISRTELPSAEQEPAAEQSAAESAEQPEPAAEQSATESAEQESAAEPAE